jgi:hypothetical protein
VCAGALVMQPGTSPRIPTLKGILGKLRPEPARELSAASCPSRGASHHEAGARRFSDG